MAKTKNVKTQHTQRLTVRDCHSLLQLNQYRIAKISGKPLESCPPRIVRSGYAPAGHTQSHDRIY